MADFLDLKANANRQILFVVVMKYPSPGYHGYWFDDQSAGFEAKVKTFRFNEQTIPYDLTAKTYRQRYVQYIICEYYIDPVYTLQEKVSSFNERSTKINTLTHDSAYQLQLEYHYSPSFINSNNLNSMKDRVVHIILLRQFNNLRTFDE